MTDIGNTPTAPTQPASTLITWAQRVVLLDLLERESGRLHQHADDLDRELSREADTYDVVDDMPGYDQRCDAVDRAYRQADTVDDMLTILECAKVLTTRPVLDRDPVAAVANALVAAHAEGRNVGEVLALAVADAQRTVFLSTAEWLTSHRPGSWEAALLGNIIESSGWEHAVSHRSGRG